MAKIVIIASAPRSLINFRGNMIQDMIENKHEVFACAPNADENIKKKLNEYGVSYHNIDLRRTKITFINDFMLFVSLVKFLKRKKPDIVLTYTIKPNIFGSLSAIITGVPTIGTMITGLGYPFSDSTGKFIKTSACLLYKMAITKKHVVFFQNKDDFEIFLKKGIIDKYSRCVMTNGSGVCLKKFYTASIPDSISFLLAARLIKEKGIKQYAEAAEIIKNKYPYIRFRLVGSYKEDRFHIQKEELKQWTNEGTIEYLGFMEDIRQIMEESSVYVLPSYYREGVPKSILEAMAMSRPVITTDSPGCRETVIDGVNGFIVPPGDVEALANAMERFIQMPDLVKKMGTASRKIAEEKYDVQKVNRIILENLGLLPIFS